jgi:hypothetical protein
MILPRLAFLLHEPLLYDHYRNVWQLLDREQFDVLLYDKFRRPPHDAFARELEQQGYRCAFVGELLRERTKYQFLVSNHYMEGRRLSRFPRAGEQYLPKRLGVRNIRFFYAVGKAGWNFAPWNELYDLFLCHGPWQAERLKAFPKARCFQMGYPRYDQFFTQRIDVDGLRARFHCRPDRPTLLWLPTWKELCSIERFAAHIAGLQDSCNVLVKPHPLSFTQEPERIRILEDHGFPLIQDDLIDMTGLYALADVVACDYGGTAFSALYLDRNLLLLDVPGAAEDALAGPGSPDVQLREVIPGVSAENPSQLREWIHDPGHWKEQQPHRETLRARYFAPYQGCSARIAAHVLSNLDQILGKP